MSIRDEVLKLIEAEKIKIAQRKSENQLNSDLCTKQFALIRPVLEQIMSAAPEFGYISFGPFGTLPMLAQVRVGERSSKFPMWWHISAHGYQGNVTWYLKEIFPYIDTDSMGETREKSFNNATDLTAYIANAYAAKVANRSIYW